MPGNEFGDRVHNFFAQDNLSQGHHSQVVGGNWPSVNNLWAASRKQVGAPSSNPKFYNPQQSEIEHVPVQHGFNFMQTTARPEFANNLPQSQQQNMNGYMYGHHVLQTRPDEANFLGLDTDSNQNNMNPRGIFEYEAQQEGVSERMLKNSDQSDAFDTHGSFDLFGGQHQMNNQHPGFLQQQQSGFSEIQQLQQQLMLRKMQELQRQKDIRQQNLNQASPFARQASGSHSHSHGLINGIQTSESFWADPATGNTNWLQRASPPVQGPMGFTHQQVDRSLYGVPVSNSQALLNPHPYVAGNSFSGNQYAGIQEQVVLQDRTSIGRQGRLAGKSLFGHTSNMEQVQQGPRNQIDLSVQDKPAIEATSSLDPDEEKILFGSDENIWDAFGNDGNMGEGGSNLLDDNEFASGLPSLQSGSWSALMQSAVAEASSSGVGLQEEWTGLNLQNQTPLADVNLSQQFQNNNPKRVMHEEIDKTSMGGLNREGFAVNTASGIPNLSGIQGGNHFGQISNGNQLNYWKHVQSSVNLSRSQLHPNKGSQVSESSFNSSDKEDLKTHEIESRSKRENSNDSYQSSSSHQANTVRLRENSGRKTSGPRKFQYHPMGNLDEDVEVPCVARLDTHAHAKPLQHFQGLRGQDQGNLGQTKISGGVPKNAADLGKGSVPDLEGMAKGPHDMRLKGMIGGHMSNMFASFDKSEKDSQPSQNMLELLHKVDKSKDPGTVRHFNPSDHMPEPEHSDGSFGALQRSHSSNSQGPSLQLGPPSQRLNNTPPSGIEIVNSNPLIQTQAPHNKSQSVFPSLPSFQEPPRGEFKNDRKVDQSQTTNGPLSIIDATQRDLEAFGRSLKPNTFHQNYSLMNQMKAMKDIPDDRSNRATKRPKGPDEHKVVGNVSTCSTTANIERNVPFVSSNIVTSIKAEHSHISPQMAPSWFDQYGTFKNSQLPQRVDSVRSVDQSVGRVSGGLEVRNLKEQASPVPPPPAIERPAAPTNVGVENLVVGTPKKRRLATVDLRPWLMEVSGGVKNPRGICTSAQEWCRAANRLMEKIDDDGEIIQDALPIPRPKRRLISTTLLMQQLLRPPPVAILSTDASSNHESLVYYVARLALGDACNLVSFPRSHSSTSRDGANCQSDQSKSSERIGDDRISKVVQDFVSKAGKLEDEFLRLDKRTILDLRLENQDVERFSIINRFARFHGRALPDGSEPSSFDAAAHAPKPFPQRYVTAIALPATLPERVHCLSL